MRMLLLLVSALVGVCAAAPAQAQSFEAGAHLAVAQWSEFDGNDNGIGGRLTFRPLPLLGLDADVTWYPSSFPPDTVAAFTGSRVEAMFGAHVGPKIGRVRPFAAAAAGFLDNRSSAAAFACIAIYPPPLACVMAGGGTLAAYQIGGGVQLDTPSRTFIRADVMSRFLKYPGPSFRGPGLSRVAEGDFVGGALKLTLGAGVRF